jgi:RecJ-like exonuclease
MFQIGIQCLFVVIVLIVWVDMTARKYREQTKKHAHEKVVDLRVKGVEADICPECTGKGTRVYISRPCEKCSGIGYVYQKPPVK